MRIVLITKRDKNTTSPRLNEWFLQRLGEFKNVKLISVEAYIHNKQRILKSPKYIIDNYKPDVVICHAHVPCLDGYFKEFKNQLKIMVAVDFWKIIQQNKLNWYYNNDFDLTIHRHHLPSIKKVDTETVWLPYSASHKEFYPGNIRLPYIGFVGNCMSPQYEERRWAIHYLDAAGLLVHNRRNRGIVRYNNNYARFLRLFDGVLCSSEFDSPFGKLFEIMGSGSIPLVPEFPGKDILFWKDTMLHYKKDCSDIEEKAKLILNDKDLRKEMSDKALKNFKKMHTDNHRIQELNDIIQAKYNGTEIPRRWGM